MSLPRMRYYFPALALAVLLLAGLPGRALAFFSPQRLQYLKTPPPDIPMPNVAEVPPPTQPGEETPHEPPPVLTETPEPASALTGLFGVAMVGLAWWRSRTRKRCPFALPAAE